MTHIIHDAITIEISNIRMGFVITAHMIDVFASVNDDDLAHIDTIDLKDSPEMTHLYDPTLKEWDKESIVELAEMLVFSSKDERLPLTPIALEKMKTAHRGTSARQ